MSAVIEKNLITIVLITTVLCVIFMDICVTSSVEYSPQRFWQLLVCMPVSVVNVHWIMCLVGGQRGHWTIAHHVFFASFLLWVCSRFMTILLSGDCVQERRALASDA